MYMHNIYAHDDADDCADKHDNKEANYERVHKDDNGDADKENGKDEDVNAQIMHMRLKIRTRTKTHTWIMQMKAILLCRLRL